MMGYRYGLFLNPSDNDPSVELQADAENKAREMSIANNGAPVAVWGENDQTVKLYAGYEAFEPAR